ncbi:MAG: hypothetical protein E6H72_14180 [Betaproteobacteria bacterium]|nr:MAG: hypothetical protein E6H72_14180 [Betaproteobacteria bacterium]
MDNDEKEIRQRYSGLTMAELIELHRSARLSAADATIVDEMLEFRGVSKTVRQKLKNSSDSAPPVPVGAIDTTPERIVLKPLLMDTISKEIGYALSALDSHSFLSITYFLGLAALSICLAYGLWGLKPWARKFMISYCALVVFLGWLVILLLFLSVDSHWRLSIEELARSTATLSGKEILKAVMYKILFVKACVWTAVYGLLMAYFFKADIRRLFQ